MGRVLPAMNAATTTAIQKIIAWKTFAGGLTRKTCLIRKSTELTPLEKRILAEFSAKLKSLKYAIA